MSRRARRIATKAVQLLGMRARRQVTAGDLEGEDRVVHMRRQGWDRVKARAGATITGYYKPRGKKYTIQCSWNTLADSVQVWAEDAHGKRVGRGRTVNDVPTVKEAVRWF